MFERSKALQIYMKPGIDEDALMLRIWESCRRHDRPQDVFRSMLRAGLVAMVESGEMPERVIEECGLEELVEKKRRRIRRISEAAQPARERSEPAAAYPPFGFPTQPPQQAPWPYPAPQPAPYPYPAAAPRPERGDEPQRGRAPEQARTAPADEDRQRPKPQDAARPEKPANEKKDEPTNPSGDGQAKAKHTDTEAGRAKGRIGKLM